MKNILLSIMLLLAPQTVLANPLDYIAVAAPAEKKLEDYTVNDIIGGAFAFKKNLHDSHPFKMVNSSNEKIQIIKSQWPGSKDPGNLDAILSLIIHAENLDQERHVTTGIYWLIHEIMDSSYSDKAAAFLRVYHAQTEQLKKRKVAFMAVELFPYLADERLLLPLKDMLDDSSIYQLHKAEGASPEIETTRQAARQMFSRFFSDKNLLSSGFPQGKFIISTIDCEVIYDKNLSEAESCALLKEWLTNHWQEITTQTTEARSNAERVYGKPSSLSQITPISRWRIGP